MTTTTLTSGTDRTAGDVISVDGFDAEGARTRMAVNMLRLGRSFGEAAEVAGVPLERIVAIWNETAEPCERPDG